MAEIMQLEDKTIDDIVTFSQQYNGTESCDFMVFDSEFMSYKIDVDNSPNPELKFNDNYGASLDPISNRIINNLQEVLLRYYNNRAHHENSVKSAKLIFKTNRFISCCYSPNFRNYRIRRQDRFY